MSRDFQRQRFLSKSALQNIDIHRNTIVDKLLITFFGFMDSFFESLHSYNIMSLWHIQLKKRSMEILCTVYEVRGIYLYETESYWDKNTCTTYEV